MGAAVALIGREVIEWAKRPKLIVDFERSKDEYPLIQDYNDESMQSADVSSSRIEFLHLVVINTGKTTAYDCEAKMELVETKRKNRYRQLLHWSRRDPRIYKSLDQIYSPINLNQGDEETIDVLLFRYWSKIGDTEPIMDIRMETASPSTLFLYADEDYYIKVTIYARNSTSKPFYIGVRWDGFIPGFGKAFTKLKSIPKEYAF